MTVWSLEDKKESCQNRSVPLYTTVHNIDLQSLDFTFNRLCMKLNFMPYNLKAQIMTINRVAQNKPDYLLLLSKFCISTTQNTQV